MSEMSDKEQNLAGGRTPSHLDGVLELLVLSLQLLGLLQGAGCDQAGVQH